jgi:outer membrane protein assembly factor BamB
MRKVGFISAGALVFALIVGLVPVELAGGSTATIANAPPDSATNYQIDAWHNGKAVAPTLKPPLYPAWDHFMGGPASYALAVGGRVFVESSPGPLGTVLHALDSATGHELWSAPAGGGTIRGIAADSANVYAVNYTGVLTAYDQSTGAVGWSTTLPGESAFTSPPTVENGVVYVDGGGTSSAGTLYAVDASSGAVMWTDGVNNGQHSSPAVTPTGVFAAFACENAYRFRPTNGGQVWLHAGACTGTGGRTAVYNTGRLYVRDDLGATPAVLNALTGQEIGTFASTYAPAFSRFAFYTPTVNGVVQLEAVDQASGNAVWTQSGDGGFDIAPILIHGLVAIGSSSGNVYLYQQKTGALVWSGSVGAPVNPVDENDPTLLSGLSAAGSNLYVPTTNGLVALAPVTPTTTTERFVPEPSFFGQLVHLTATVNPTDGGGTVTFSFAGNPILGCDNLPLGTGTGAAANQAACSTTLLPPGSDEITASYSGDAAFAASSVTDPHLVLKDRTATVAQPAVLKLLLGVKLFVLQATVTNTTFHGAPVVGVPVFMSAGGTIACEGTTNAQGVATCNGLFSLLPILLSFGYEATFPGNAFLDGSSGHAGLIGF